tara:strand:- start:87 stop:650 length:564 start_codon:yes stop_codon:yes gene_type:complete
MAEEFIDADTMARLSAMMRRAPMDQGSAAGMVPSPALPPNPYNTEFPDYIGNPNANAVMPEISSMIGPDFLEGIRARQEMRERAISTELPPVYNERFSDLVGRPPQSDPLFGLDRAPGAAGPNYPQYDPYADDYPDWRKMINYAPRRLEVPIPSRMPDPERDARVEQLMRELEEQQALEARLQALGR